MSETTKTKSQLRHESLAENLEQRYSGQGCEVSMGLGEVTMTVPRDIFLEVAG